MNRKIRNYPLSLKNLLDIDEWQKIQHNFSLVTEVNVRTLDSDGKLFSTAGMGARFCHEIIKDPSLKNKLCGLCLPTFLGGKHKVDNKLNYYCLANLCNFITPLTIYKNMTLGYLILGPVILVKRKSKQDYAQLAEELNVSLDEFWSAILEIRVISFQGMQSLVELIKDVGEYTLELAYKNKILEQQVTTLEENKLVKLLDELLDVSFEVSGANVGSIMFLDRAKDALTIRTSRGIPREVVRNARVRVGEGVSGIAAKEGRAFLIDDDTQDNRIKPYLKRPSLGSSMVLPFKVTDKSMGVMNLGASKESQVRFNPKNLNLMNRLINLTVSALEVKPT